jgi:hypothetical protein
VYCDFRDEIEDEPIEANRRKSDVVYKAIRHYMRTVDRERKLGEEGKEQRKEKGRVNRREVMVITEEVSARWPN